MLFISLMKRELGDTCEALMIRRLVLSRIDVIEYSTLNYLLLHHHFSPHSSCCYMFFATIYVISYAPDAFFAIIRRAVTVASHR